MLLPSKQAVITHMTHQGVPVRTLELAQALKLPASAGKRCTVCGKSDSCEKWGMSGKLNDMWKAGEG